ncbi:hypothetical protein N806_26165 [Rhodococcus sp. P27]|nr:hypothetical protein N806_26165 [Rhodococcus sp. P27]
MSVDSGSHRVIVVLRPTVSGLDESAARRMFDTVRAGTDATFVLRTSMSRRRAFTRNSIERILMTWARSC